MSALLELVMFVSVGCVALAIIGWFIERNDVR